MDTLDELGILQGTDKSSLQHDYLAKYARLFAPFRDLPITVIEIGIDQGASLRMWEQYFARASIVGIDIQERCRQFEGGRRHVEIADQSDVKAMTGLGRRYQPAIVIDDGSHRADHILASFEALFPHVAAGGIYVVEDLGFHVGPDALAFRGSAASSPQAYFSRLALHCCVYEEAPADRALAFEVDSIEFIQNAAVVRKKPPIEADHVARRRTLVAAAGSHDAWGWFSGYLVRAGGFAEESIQCARRAIELAPGEAVHYRELIDALDYAGRLEEALAVAETAARRWPEVGPFAAAQARIREREKSPAGG